MTQLKNEKILSKDGKLFLIDAPELKIPDGYYNSLKTGRCDFPCLENEICHCEIYEEALSKAPTWEIKNKEEVKGLIYKENDPNWNVIAFQNWQPEQSKLYALPVGYTYRFEYEKRFTLKYPVHVAILIPQEEVREEESIDSIIEQVWAKANDLSKGSIGYDKFTDFLKSRFYITRR